MNMTKISTLRNYTALCILICGLLLQLPALALATPNEKVRIGYFPLKGFYNIAPDGRLTGYGRDLTDTIVSHAGWNSEYVRYASWVEALGALSVGDIDILAPAQHTAERDKVFTFDTFPIGTEYGSLLTLSTNDALLYEDYSAFNNLRVGIVGSSVFFNDFKEYQQRNGFSANLIYYKDSPALVAALNAGEVDAIMTNLMVKTKTMKLLAKFGSASYYYMLSPKAHHLRAELNQAIDRLTTQHPTFLGELYATWFPSHNDIPLSKQELDYIASAGVLKIACSVNSVPYSYMDKASGELRGVKRLVLERIAQRTGLQFSYEAIPEGKDVANFVKSNGIALLAGVEHEQRISLHDEDFTVPYFTTAKYFWSLTETTIDAREHARVAVANANDAQTALWQQQYPYFEFKQFASVDECLKALRTDKADLILSDRYAMKRLLAKPYNDDLQCLPAQTVKSLLCCKIIERKNSHLLTSILNKTIKQISAEETAQDIDASLLATRYQYVFSDFVYQYRYALMVFSIIGGFSIAALVLILRTRRKIQRQIELSEMKLRHITNNINGGVVVLKADEGMEITYANKGFLELIGCTQEQFDQSTDNSYLAYVHPCDLHKIQSAIDSDSSELSLELRILRTDNNYVSTLFNCTVGKADAGEKELYCVILDLTEQNRMLDKLRIENRRMEFILGRIEEIFYEVNLCEHSIITSSSFAEKLGWNFPQHIKELTIDEFNKQWHAMPEDIGTLYSDTKKMLGDKKPTATVMRIESKRLGYIWCEVQQYPILLKNGKIASVIGLIRDIDEQVTERERLMEQALRDPLTGLYNKEAFESMASDALAQLPNQNHALIFIDLDHFKKLNDTLGHMVGDRAICDAADKLRIIFSNYDLVALFGGDEFCIFVKNIPFDTLQGKLDWLVGKLRNEYSGKRGTIHITCSCGVACTMSSGYEYAQLMHNADQALYYSKENGRDKYTFFSELPQAAH